MPRAARAKRMWRVKGGVVRAGVLAAACALAVFAPVFSQAQEINFFRLGTGSVGGTYHPIGGIIASAISKPPGSRECDLGGSCGVPGLIAVAQSSEGSVDNVTAIGQGTLESGLAQADVSYWAHHGVGIFEKTGPVRNLRTIANLFPESIHLVVRRNAGIFSVADLRGKRISLDRDGSGTRVDALLILKAYGLDPSDLDARALAAGHAADLLRAGELDGFFMVAGTPVNVVSGLAEESLIELVPIKGPEAEKLVEEYPFFRHDRVIAGTYFNVPVTETLSVGAHWLVSADVPADTVYQITRALWHESTRRLLDNGHPKGKLIQINSALDRLVVPLHPGARRYYAEAGMTLPSETD